MAFAFSFLQKPSSSSCVPSSSRSHPFDSQQKIRRRRPSSAMAASFSRRRSSLSFSISCGSSRSRDGASSSSSSSSSSSATPAFETDPSLRRSSSLNLDHQPYSHTALPPAPRRHAADSIPQELTVYEFNEGDRDSPRLLPFNKPGFDVQRLKVVGGLGLFVPFTNKLYSGSLRKRLGITAGYCFVIRYDQKAGGSIFEAAYSFYFGDLGHISVQGPYKDYEDTELTVTGGTGVFLGAYGSVTLSNVKFPTSLFYRFRLYGIPDLPPELRWETVPPTEGVRPFPGANDAGIALPNFND